MGDGQDGVLLHYGVFGGFPAGVQSGSDGGDALRKCPERSGEHTGSGLWGSGYLGGRIYVFKDVHGHCRIKSMGGMGGDLCFASGFCRGAAVSGDR